MEDHEISWDVGTTVLFLSGIFGPKVRIVVVGLDNSGLVPGPLCVETLLDTSSIHRVALLILLAFCTGKTTVLNAFKPKKASLETVTWRARAFCSCLHQGMPRNR